MKRPKQKPATAPKKRAREYRSRKPLPLVAKAPTVEEIQRQLHVPTKRASELQQLAKRILQEQQLIADRLAGKGSV